MADRSLKLYGTAYSTAGNASIVMSINGTEVYTGNVTTVNSSSPGQNKRDPSAIASFTIDDSISGNISVSISASNGDVFIAGFGNDDQMFGDVNGQLKSNVTIDGDAHELEVFDINQTGEIHFTLPAESLTTFTYNMPEV